MSNAVLATADGRGWKRIPDQSQTARPDCTVGITLERDGVLVQRELEEPLGRVSE
jgi:hypothetical protein